MQLHHPKFRGDVSCADGAVPDLIPVEMEGQDATVGIAKSIHKRVKTAHAIRIGDGFVAEEHPPPESADKLPVAENDDDALPLLVNQRPRLPDALH